MTDAVIITPPEKTAATLAMAEYARQSFHLARGGSDLRGEIVEDGKTRALWCRRTDTTMRSMLCAVLDNGRDDPGLVDRILDEHRPDGAIIRRLGATTQASPVRFHRGNLLLSLGLVETEEILPLPDDFGAFVAGLGRVTRAHTRSSLRHMVRQGLYHTLTTGEPAVATPEILSLCERNLPKAMARRQLDDCLRDVNAQSTPFRSELRGPDGALISIILGYLDAGHAMLVCQLNPKDAPKVGQAGCSLLHRALLIRELISLGTNSLIMVNGCSGMLRPYCWRVTAETLLSISLAPLAWLRCLVYFSTRPYLWTFLTGRLAARRGSP